MARDAKGRYCKGVSGNPGGRPAADISISALIDAAVSKEDWDFILHKLVAMARRGNLKAMEMLFDRRFGKAVQINEHTGKDGKPIEIVEVVTDAGK